MGDILCDLLQVVLRAMILSARLCWLHIASVQRMEKTLKPLINERKDTNVMLIIDPGPCCMQPCDAVNALFRNKFMDECAAKVQKDMEDAEANAYKEYCEWCDDAAFGRFTALGRKASKEEVRGEDWSVVK